MNKFTISLLLILVLNTSSVISIDQKLIENIFDKVMIILEGMTEPEAKEKKCINYLIKNKPSILNLAVQILPVIDNIAIVSQKMLEFIGKNPSAISVFYSSCAAERFIELYNKSIDDKKRIYLIEEIGERVKKRVDEFHEASSNFVKVRGIDGKLILLGKIISIFFDLKFK